MHGVRNALAMMVLHATQTGDEDIDRLFELAGALQANFHEDWYGAGRTERGPRYMETLLDNPEPSVNGQGRRRPVQSPD